MRKTIYLAGPMLNCNDIEMNHWRDKVKKILSPLYQFLDPVEFEVKSGTKEDRIRLVEGDLDAIKRSDILLAYCWKASPGTSQEIVYAKKIYEKEVILVNTIESPWLEYHADFSFQTLDQAIDHLMEAAK